MVMLADGLSQVVLRTVLHRTLNQPRGTDRGACNYVAGYGQESSCGEEA